MKGKYRFSKDERLKSDRDIEALFKKGISKFIFPFKVSLRFISTEEESPRVLVGVSKRNIPLAVDRNRIKRLIREAYRLQKGECATIRPFHLGLVYTHRKIISFEQIAQKISRVIHFIKSCA